MTVTVSNSAPSAGSELAGGAGRDQTRARYPDEQGYVERDGVRVFYEVYGEGEHDRAALAHVVDRPLAVLEVPDPLPGAVLPRGHLRRTRQRPLGPAGGSRGLQHRRVRLRRAGRDGRDRHRARHSGGGVVRGALGHRPRGGSSRARRRRRLHRPRGRAGAGASRARSPPVRPIARDRGTVGEVQQPLLAPGLPRLRRVLLRPVLQRAALDQADRGLHRVGASDHARDADRRDTGNRPAPLTSGSSRRARACAARPW